MNCEGHEKRDVILKKDLSPEKINLIEKFHLVSTTQNQWISQNENAHKHLIFKHEFVKQKDILDLLFRINELCFAKLNYFKKKLDQYEFYFYDFKKGFILTELWDADFFRHKTSGYYIDLRQLKTIVKIEDFIVLYQYLESFEKK